MKKITLILICLLISICFISCSKQITLKEDNNVTTNQTSNEFTSQDNTDKIINPTEEVNDNNANSEKIILTFYGETSESNYDEESEELIEAIKSCKEIPEINIVEKIGKISIKNKDSNDIVDIADIYIGADYNIYAKYISNTNNDYAYRLDPENLQ